MGRIDCQARQERVGGARRTDRLLSVDDDVDGVEETRARAIASQSTNCTIGQLYGLYRTLSEGMMKDILDLVPRLFGWDSVKLTEPRWASVGVWMNVRLLQCAMLGQGEG